ncbi:MAG TPA: glycogen debranching enzyme N-terminal domain-containing protein [Paludibacteraceae bacterium]|nr:glycogen debranching enzyme N-terminal domain-containing protein [Paludibacteraceae bacterium]
MSYLKFDRMLLTNLEKSLDKEMLRTNKAGAYASTTIIDCNTRKYHGLFVVPVPNLGIENYVLLSSLDETVIQHGAEFNLGIHKYQGDYYSPRGHKYIREFHIDTVARTIYRVGGVVLQKERTFVSGESRMLIRYTLLDAHSATTLRFKPFLAFRSVNELTRENSNINRAYSEVENGISWCLYSGYPNLVIQFNKKVEFIDNADWYKGIEYYKEQERGYDFKEDLYVPGYFELPIKKGETIIVSAGLEPVACRSLKKMFDYEFTNRTPRNSFFNCLKNAAQQFYNKREDGYYLLAGYPWFKYRARDEFIALPGTTLAIGDIDMFEKMMEIGVKAVDDFLAMRPKTTLLKEVSSPDVLLWFLWDIQQYAKATSIEQAAEKYDRIVNDIIVFIRSQKHPNLFLHENGLLYTNGQSKPATWMNAEENGYPITPRTGYIVEINALWYNGLKFASEMAQKSRNKKQADILNYQAEISRQAFVDTFWNGNYLFDFVDSNYQDREVRPNMIFAISLPYSPLDKRQQKLTLDIITRELLTIKGLRSLSPKSPIYRPEYIGGQLERDRNYHNGPVWPWTIAAFAEAYLKIYKMSGVSFVQRLLGGFETELRELTVGTLSELYDGNPPFRGHGAMSYAMTVGEVLRTLHVLESFVKENEIKDK